MDIPKERIILVTGHYGSGKTNFTLNLAEYLLARGEELTLIDLDIVNPYFRTGDYADKLPCRLVAPEFLGTTLDTPSLTAEIDAVIVSGGRVLVDVGGDDAGSAALGRYSAKIAKAGYAMYCVINAYRGLTREPEEAVGILREIEAASRLTATALVNNSNLGRETVPEDVEASVPYADEVARLTGLPMAATCVRRGFDARVPEPFPVDIKVTFPWENDNDNDNDKNKEMRQ